MSQTGVDQQKGGVQGQLVCGGALTGHVKRRVDKD